LLNDSFNRVENGSPAGTRNIFLVVIGEGGAAIATKEWLEPRYGHHHDVAFVTDCFFVGLICHESSPWFLITGTESRREDAKDESNRPNSNDQPEDALQGSADPHLKTHVKE
jgi:hypothetical protein